MNLRHELKYVTTPGRAQALRSSLSALMDKDPNGNAEGAYQIISLYYDTIDGAAFFDKLNGIEYRRKYRIRTYNANRSFFKLECKYKLQDWTAKESETIDPQLVRALMNGLEVRPEDETAGPLTKRFLREITMMNLKPSVIIQYQRTALVSEDLDVRVTFDEQIRMGSYTTDVFSPDLPLIPVVDEESVVVEVKYNEVLPMAIALLLRPMTMQRLAVSKYALGYNKK
jgi:hypothetical protein